VIFLLIYLCLNQLEYLHFPGIGVWLKWEGTSLADETVAAFTALVRGLAPLAGTQIDKCNHLIYIFILIFFLQIKC